MRATILLPGVTTLARLVAKVRDETTRQLWEELAALPDPIQRRALVATIRNLEGRSIDDALKLLDLLMTTELLGRAQRELDKENARRHPRLARASARLAVAVEALFESDGWGGPGEEPRVSEVWETIEAVVSRAELRAALALVTESVPPPGGPDPDDWRAALPARYPAVSGFLKMLPAVIEFGASAEGAPVLAAMRALPDVLPEVLLEVMSWAPELADAFTAASGGRSRLDDLPTSIAACLAAHAMNVGYRPIAKKGAPALERSRLSHVFQNYVRPETLATANAPLVARQAGLPLAQAWGGGMVAAVDGMRFSVPVPPVRKPGSAWTELSRPASAGTAPAGHDLAQRHK